MARLKSQTDELRVEVSAEQSASIANSVAADLARARLANGEASFPDFPRSKTAVETSRDELEEYNQKYHCFVELLPPTVSGVAAGGPRIALKDVMAYGNYRPTAGLAEPPPGLVLEPSPVVERLLRSGADIVGTTRLPAWCYLPLEYSPDLPTPLHPKQPGLAVGGSSSGSAVAVASGAVDIALGTDTGGSVRIPAALCGVVGFKPSQDRISCRGVVPLSPTQDTVGIISKSCSDALAMFLLIADDKPCNSSPESLPTRIGIPDGAFDGVAKEVLRACEMATDLMNGGMHATCVAPPIDIPRMNGLASIITAYEAAGIHSLRMAAFPDCYPWYVRDRLLNGFAVDGQTYAAALATRRTLISRIVSHVFGSADVLMTPTVRHHAIEALPSNCVPDRLAAQSRELLDLNRWVNLLGLPAISVPMPVDVLPASVQLIGRPGADVDLLRLASRLFG